MRPAIGSVVMLGDDNARILGRTTLGFLGIFPNTGFDRIPHGKSECSAGAYKLYNSVRFGVIYPAENLGMARYSESETVFSHGVDTHDPQHSEDRPQSGQNVATTVDRGTRGDCSRQEVDEGRLARRDSSDLDARKPDKPFSSFAVEIPWVCLMFRELVV